MMINGSRAAGKALIAACSLVIGWSGPLQAQSLFSTPSPQSEHLARTPSSATPTQVRTGTAFFVDDAGNMLTAAHVAAGCARIVVAKEGQALAGRVVALSSQVDLALIKVPRTLGLSAVFPRSVRLAANDMLFTADYEFLPALTAHGGALSNATVAASGAEPGYISIDSNATFGASGAPVLDSRGLFRVS